MDVVSGINGLPFGQLRGDKIQKGLMISDGHFFRKPHGYNTIKRLNNAARSWSPRSWSRRQNFGFGNSLAMMTSGVFSELDASLRQYIHRPALPEFLFELVTH